MALRPASGQFIHDGLLARSILPLQTDEEEAARPEATPAFTRKLRTKTPSNGNRTMPLPFGANRARAPPRHLKLLNTTLDESTAERKNPSPAPRRGILNGLLTGSPPHCPARKNLLVQGLNRQIFPMAGQALSQASAPGSAASRDQTFICGLGPGDGGSARAWRSG